MILDHYRLGQLRKSWRFRTSSLPLPSVVAVDHPLIRKKRSPIPCKKRLGTGTLPSTAHAQKEKGIPHTHVLRSAEPCPCSCHRPRPVMPVDNGACTSVARESDPVDQDGRSWLRKPWQHLFHERCDSRLVAYGSAAQRLHLQTRNKQYWYQPIYSNHCRGHPVWSLPSLKELEKVWFCETGVRV